MTMRYKIPASILPFFQTGAANVSPPGGDGGTGTVCAAICDITAPQRPGGKLQQALNIVEGVLNAVPDILLEVDREGRCLNVWTQNPDVLATQKEALLGRTVHEVLSPENAAGAVRAIAEADEKGFSYGFTARIVQRNGESRWYEHSLAKKCGCSPSEVSYIVLSRDVTKRKRMEEALAQKEKEFRSLAENLPEPVFRYDQQCRRIYVNPAVKILTRNATETLLGKTPTEVRTGADPAEARRIQENIQRVLDSGEKDEVEVNIIIADGSRRWYRIINVPEFGPDGSVLSVLSIGRDETERHRLEAELRRRAALEEQVSSLAQAVPGFLFLGRIEADGRAHFPFASEGVFELFGLHPEDIHDDAEVLRARYHPEDRLRVRACMAESARQLTPYRIELRIAHPEKGERWIEIRGTPRRKEDGATEWHGLMFDITESREVGHSLDEMRRRLLSVLQTIPDMVWLKDVEGVYLLCNHAFERLIGKPEAEIVGKTDCDLFVCELAEFFRKKDAEAIRVGCIRVNEEWVTYPDNGRRALLETRKVPVFGPDGRVAGVLGVARDITEHRRMQDELARREREFRTLVENSPDTVARYGADLRRQYVNPAFAALVEGGAAALIGKTPAECPGGPNAAIYERELGEVIASGRDRKFELQWQGKDGRECCSLIHMTPEFDRDGTVQSILAVGRDISELHVSRRKIHRMAFYDPLTGLPNRTLFNDRLARIIADASRHGGLAGVMMIDLDRFKAVNDTFGHAVGDELLREAAARLSASVRAADTVARLGGDEFAILLPDIRAGADLGSIAGKILGKFAERFLLVEKEVFVSCSIGIALYPNDSTDAQDLLKYADSAMYFAKHSGRNNFRFYARKLTARANERLILEAELRHAVERGELELHYQPKVLLENGEVIGSEALLRWSHPRFGMVRPDRFIPIAEDTGQIIDLGMWVLREACRAAAAWNGTAAPLHKVAINLSARQFQGQDLVTTVAATLEETACRPEWIELEITESLLLDEDGKAQDMLRGLRAMGVSIAIDDFGTGYSALSYLARFPVDTLKIDRSFIRSVTTDTYHAELVKAILSISRCLGQQVVAEGVETVEQVVFLKTHGCQAAQGFLYSKPLPKSEISLLMRHFRCAGLGGGG